MSLPVYNSLKHCLIYGKLMLHTTIVTHIYAGLHAIQGVKNIALEMCATRLN